MSESDLADMPCRWPGLVFPPTGTKTQEELVQEVTACYQDVVPLPNGGYGATGAPARVSECSSGQAYINKMMQGGHDVTDTGDRLARMAGHTPKIYQISRPGKVRFAAIWMA